MDLSVYFKSVVDNDNCAIVICNLDHEIIYMNPAAVARYAKRGGEKLVGSNLLKCHHKASADAIRGVLAWFEASPGHNRMFTHHRAKENKDVYMIAMRDSNNTLIGYYEKHEYRTPESAAPYAFEDQTEEKQEP